MGGLPMPVVARIGALVAAAKRVQGMETTMNN